MANLSGVWPQTIENLLGEICNWLEQSDDRESSWSLHTLTLKSCLGELKTVRDGLIEIESPESSLIDCLNRAVSEIETALVEMQAHHRQLALEKIGLTVAILSSVTE